MEEGADCVSLLVYYQGGLNGHVSKPMWKLFPQLLFAVTGHDPQTNPHGGLGFEHFGRIAIAIQNYISRDS
jgi:hypothetical protein